MSGEFAGISNNPLVITMYLIESTYKLDKVRLKYIWNELNLDSMSHFAIVYHEIQQWKSRDEWQWKCNKLSDTLKDKIDYILAKNENVLQLEWL